MASTYTTGFGIEKIGDGEQAGAWGTTTNHNLDIIDRIASYKAVGLSGTTHTLTIREASPGSGTENLQDGMYRVIKFTGALGGNNTVTIAPNTSPAWFIIENATPDSGSSGPYSVILTPGSGANITVLNGKNAAVYCDGAGSGAAIYDAFADLQVATLDASGDITGSTLNADGDTAAGDNAAIGYTSAEGLILTGQGSTSDITVKNDADGTVFTVPTGTDDILFPDDAKAMWGAGSDLQVYHDGSNSYIADSGTGNLKLKGSQIDIQDTSGNDDFSFTANNLNVLSGSTLTIDSGATITNSGTATGFGADAERAFSGVLQTNANFVDQVIFGPSVDGRAWNGFWSKASVFSSLMLATIEDEGSNTEINIWDLTEQSGGTISTTPLATVDLASAATPDCITACMGYLCIGTEDGTHIVDPHDGAWAERTSGWPRSLSTSSDPALPDNGITDLASLIALEPVLDSRTGGPMPTFLFTANSIPGVITDNGEVWNRNAADSRVGIAGARGGAFNGRNATSKELNSSGDVQRITASNSSTMDSGGTVGGPTPSAASFGILQANTTAIQGNDRLMVRSSPSGLDVFTEPNPEDAPSMMVAQVNRTYNTGYMPINCKLAVLANNVTTDYSGNSNTLTQNGSVTVGAVASGAELNGYSGFSSSINFTRASDSDWDEITTGPITLTGWFKSSGNSGNEDLFGFGKSDDSITYFVRLNTSGIVTGYERGATAADRTVASTQTYDDGVWHRIDFVRYSSTDRALYIDGVVQATSTDDGGSLSSSGNLPFAIGVNYDGSSVPAATSTITLVRLSQYGLNTAQVRKAYEHEKSLFAANAECLLQSGSTDAVLDVGVDPLSSKYIVTQTDAITIFDGLLIDSKPTVNSGSSEKGRLWGDLRAEQNSANAYVTAPAVDQRQVNEMVRGLASDLPGGPDLSKAKAWINFDGTGTVGINGAFNIKSLTDNGTGDYTVAFSVPFKDTSYVTVGGSKNTGSTFILVNLDNVDASRFSARVSTRDVDSTGGTSTDADPVFVVFFGELENE